MLNLLAKSVRMLLSSERGLRKSEADILAALRPALEGGTKDPVRLNGFQRLDGDELLVRLAVHILQDRCDEPTVLAHGSGVYLIASILGEGEWAAGTVEYQVSDGLPGKRSHSHDFYTLAQAKEFYNLVAACGGWAAYAVEQA